MKVFPKRDKIDYSLKNTDKIVKMGIKHFYYWMKKNFGSQTNTDLRRGQPMPQEVDVFLMDLNGIFHNSAQKIFQYGNHKPEPRLLHSAPTKPNYHRTQKKVFDDVCRTIDIMVKKVNPTSTVVMCIDGPAPLSKQVQQRERRYKSAAESTGDCIFDSNAITPGTVFMDQLSRSIDGWLRTKMIQDPVWNRLNVIFSNEKSPGEGEHKCLDYVRKTGKADDRYCIHGMDADLIMLALASGRETFYVIREEMYDKRFDFSIIDICRLRKALEGEMHWETSEKRCNNKSLIEDFILLCFLVGNDFLPHIPSIEIIENGIPLILEFYQRTAEVHGHFVDWNEKRPLLNMPAIKSFFEAVASQEENMFLNKMRHRSSFFPDPLLDECSTFSGSTMTFDITRFRSEYLREHFAGHRLTDVCNSYFEGMQWVLEYYLSGVPNWDWYCPMHHAPTAYHLSQKADEYSPTPWGRSSPSTPLLQLLSVLPPKSARLLPDSMRGILTEDTSSFAPYCPQVFDIDLSGKRKEWEGIAMLPYLDYNLARKLHRISSRNFSTQEKKRDIRGKSFQYAVVFPENSPGIPKVESCITNDL